MYEDLIYQIESAIGDSDDDPDGLMKIRKLVDILNSASKAVACQKVKLLQIKAGRTPKEWAAKCETMLAEMRNERQELLKLLVKG